MGSTSIFSPLTRKLVRRFAVWQMSGLVLAHAQRRTPNRFKLAGFRSRWDKIRRRGEDGMRIGLLNRMGLAWRRRGHRRFCPPWRARGDDLRDSDGQQNESDDGNASERRVAVEWASEDETEEFQRNDASANDAQRNAGALLLGPLPFDFWRLHHRRRVVRRRNLPGQSLRDRSQISSAHCAESFSGALIRPPFWTEHRNSFGSAASGSQYSTH